MKKKLQPKLKSKRARHKMWTKLPAPVAYGVRELAVNDNTSVSAIIAEVVCGFFDIDYKTGEPFKNVIEFRRRA